MNMNDDADPAETGEWLDALKAVELHRGQERANLLVNRLVDQARRDGLYIPRSLTTAYKNTIPPEQEAIPGGVGLQPAVTGTALRRIWLQSRGRAHRAGQEHDSSGAGSQVAR